MKCTACHRPLKNPSPTGMGPVCARRQAGIEPRHRAIVADPNQTDLFNPNTEKEDDVTIDEAKKARQQLEDDILDLLVKYRDASGLTPTGVVLDVLSSDRIGGQQDMQLLGVRVQVEV